MMDIIRDSLIFLKGVNVETVSATVYLTPESAPFQLLTPSGGTIKVLMFALPPAGGKPNGRPLLVANATGSGQSITVKDSTDSTTFATLLEGSWAVLVSGASTWQVLAKGALVTGSLAGGADLNGTELILDADADTSITADTDDQIDIRISGADDFRFIANIFRALSGSSIETDTINETTAAAGVTVDSCLIKDGRAALLATAAMFTSTEQTGTGSSQNIAHGFGSTPSSYQIIPSDTTAGWVVSARSADATNVTVTVTNGAKFYVHALK